MAKQSAKAYTGDLMGTLRKLHQEHCNSLRELTTQQERNIEAALQSCMAELSNIEAEAANEVRKSADAFAAADRETPQPGVVGSHYWDHQKRLTEVTNGARERADAARKAYLDAWRTAEQAHRDSMDKARRDYIARVQDAWKNANVDDLDSGATSELVRGLDLIVNQQSANWG
jgi:hypothetical protein